MLSDLAANNGIFENKTQQDIDQNYSIESKNQHESERSHLIEDKQDNRQERSAESDLKVQNKSKQSGYQKISETFPLTASGYNSLMNESTSSDFKADGENYREEKMDGTAEITSSYNVPKSMYTKENHVENQPTSSNCVNNTGISTIKEKHKEKYTPCSSYEIRNPESQSKSHSSMNWDENYSTPDSHLDARLPLYKKSEENLKNQAISSGNTMNGEEDDDTLKNEDEKDRTENIDYQPISIGNVM